MVREHDLNKLDNFIKGFYISEDTCDKINDYFNDILIGKKPSNPPPIEAKDRGYTVCDLNHTFPEELVQEYFKELFTAVNQYKEAYPACYQDMNPWGLHPHINVQHYKPGDSYSHWHCENTGYDKDLLGRCLVFITYLNDVTDSGETEFLHQNLKIKPEKGLTVIFPTNWPWLHRGVPSPTQEKNIVTGWFHFMYRDKDNNWTM